MAESKSGHLSTGGKVTTERRPPGPVPMKHLVRLGSTTAPTSNPNGVPMSPTPTVKPTW